MASLFQPAPEPKTELGRVRVLSSLAGVRVSPLQLGAMSIGDAWSSFMGSMSKEDSFKLLDAYYEAGGNFIDTANNYQDEQSESWLGEWMAGRGIRDQMVVATKFTTAYNQYKLGKDSHSVNFSGNHRRSLHVSVRDSLRKLRTDYIDILYLHWWDHTTSIAELMDSLDALVKQGKVLYLGISDSPAWVVSAANEYALARGKTPFAVYQGQWNVLVRDFERDILPMAQHYGMALAPWDALGGGKFQSKKQLEQRREGGEGLRKMFGSGEQTPEQVRASEVLEKIAAEHGIESVTAVALAYVMAKAPFVFPIVGGRKVEHLHDNIQALKITLTRKQVEELEAVKPLDPGFPQRMIGKDPKNGGQPGMMLGLTAQFSTVQESLPVGYTERL